MLRSAQRPAQQLDYGEMMLNRGSPPGTQGESPEDIRKHFPFLGKDWGLEEPSEYSADYRELAQDLFQTLSKQEAKGDTEYTAWGSLLRGQGHFNSSAGDSLLVSAE